MFCVYLTKYSGTKLPSWYIGSSSEEKIIKGYNGSVKSKKFKNIYLLEQKENKHLFKTRILSRHKTRTEALAEEIRVQKLHLVMTNDNYYNEAYASVNGFFGMDVSGSSNPNYGNKWDDSQREHLSSIQKIKMKGDGNPNYGNKWTEEQKLNMSNYKKSLNLRAHNRRSFSVFDENDENIYSDISLADVKKLSKSLLKTNKYAKLGNTKIQIGHLTKNDKLHMAGWYIEET